MMIIIMVIMMIMMMIISLSNRCRLLTVTPSWDGLTVLDGGKLEVVIINFVIVIIVIIVTNAIIIIVTIINVTMDHGGGERKGGGVGDQDGRRAILPLHHQGDHDHDDCDDHDADNASHHTLIMTYMHR